MLVWGLGLKREWPEAGKDTGMQVEGAARYSSADLMGQPGAASPRLCGGEQFVDSSSARTLPSIGQCAR